jgi:hypothetical protein
MNNKSNRRLSVIQFVKIICSTLEISIPKIYKVQRLSTPTTLAEYDKENDILFYVDLGDLDIYFNIAHELRHKWQFKYHPDWFENYNPSKNLSVIEYNMQQVELDANGFAIIAYADLLGLKPTFDGVDDTVVNAIFDMADKIAEEMS